MSPALQGSLLQLVQQDSQGLPKCWSSAHYGVLVQVDGEEEQLVQELLAVRLGKDRSRVQFEKVLRVQNQATFRAFRRDTEHTLMFHGCKTISNETSIVREGFRIACCVSGGANYGTWFAYNASYSDSSNFAFTDADGWRHIFVCLVSRSDVKRDDSAMRVVGQGCAYPHWVVHYRHF